MKNTSILIPIILISCLLALGYLLYQALQTAENNRPNQQIVLNADDYADEPAPSDIGQSTDYDAASRNGEIVDDPNAADIDDNAATNGNSPSYEENQMVEMTAAERQQALEDERREAQALAEKEAQNNRIIPAPREGASSSRTSGRYLVIAGSFRQKLNAEERVEALISAGFPETRVEYFNRGTYAVALAGQNDRYSIAEQMAANIRKAGIEAKVMRRR